MTECAVHSRIGLPLGCDRATQPTGEGAV